ncbi:MAG: hypothetical protein WC511_01585 [Candidatus Pacearchaeota archaeon]
MSFFELSFFQDIPITKLRVYLVVLGFTRGTLNGTGSHCHYIFEARDTKECGKYPRSFQVLVPETECVESYLSDVKKIFESIQELLHIPLPVSVALVMKDEKEEAWLFATPEMDLIVRPMKSAKEYGDELKPVLRGLTANAVILDEFANFKNTTGGK